MKNCTYRYINTVVSEAYVELKSERDFPAEQRREILRHAQVCDNAHDLGVTYSVFSTRSKSNHYLPILVAAKSAHKQNSKSFSVYTQAGGWNFEDGMFNGAHYDEMLEGSRFLTEDELDAAGSNAIIKADSAKSTPYESKGLKVSHDAARAVLYATMFRWLRLDDAISIAVPESECESEEKYTSYVFRAVKTLYSYLPAGLRSEAGFCSYLSPSRSAEFPRFYITFIPESQASSRSIRLDGSTDAQCRKIVEWCRANDEEKNFLEHIMSLNDKEREIFFEELYKDVENAKIDDPVAGIGVSAFDTLSPEAYENKYGYGVGILDNTNTDIHELLPDWERFSERGGETPERLEQRVWEYISKRCNAEQIKEYVESEHNVDERLDRIIRMAPFAQHVSGAGEILWNCAKETIETKKTETEDRFNLVIEYREKLCQISKKKWQELHDAYGKEIIDSKLSKAANEIDGMERKNDRIEDAYANKVLPKILSFCYGKVRETCELYEIQPDYYTGRIQEMARAAFEDYYQGLIRTALEADNIENVEDNEEIKKLSEERRILRNQLIDGETEYKKYVQGYADHALMDEIQGQIDILEAKQDVQEIILQECHSKFNGKDVFDAVDYCNKNSYANKLDAAHLDKLVEDLSTITTGFDLKKYQLRYLEDFNMMTASKRGVIGIRVFGNCIDQWASQFQHQMETSQRSVFDAVKEAEQYYPLLNADQQKLITASIVNYGTGFSPEAYENRYLEKLSATSIMNRGALGQQVFRKLAQKTARTYYTITASTRAGVIHQIDQCVKETIELGGDLKNLKFSFCGNNYGESQLRHLMACDFCDCTLEEADKQLDLFAGNKIYTVKDLPDICNSYIKLGFKLGGLSKRVCDNRFAGTDRDRESLTRFFDIFIGGYVLKSPDYSYGAIAKVLADKYRGSGVPALDYVLGTLVKKYGTSAGTSNGGSRSTTGNGGSRSTTGNGGSRSDTSYGGNTSSASHSSNTGSTSSTTSVNRPEETRQSAQSTQTVNKPDDSGFTITVDTIDRSTPKTNVPETKKTYTYTKAEEQEESEELDKLIKKETSEEAKEAMAAKKPVAIIALSVATALCIGGIVFLGINLNNASNSYKALGEKYNAISTKLTETTQKLEEATKTESEQLQLIRTMITNNYGNIISNLDDASEAIRGEGTVSATSVANFWRMSDLLASVYRNNFEDLSENGPIYYNLNWYSVLPTGFELDNANGDNYAILCCGTDETSGDYVSLYVGSCENGMANGKGVVYLYSPYGLGNVPGNMAICEGYFVNGQATGECEVRALANSYKDYSDMDNYVKEFETTAYVVAHGELTNGYTEEPLECAVYLDGVRDENTYIFTLSDNSLILASSMTAMEEQNTESEEVTEGEELTEGEGEGETPVEEATPTPEPTPTPDMEGSTENP